MPSRRTVLAFALVLSALAAAAAPTVARPPPEPLCAVCTDQLADSASDHGVDLEPGESRLAIRTFENGSSRWTARVTLDSAAADAFRTNDTLRRAVVADARHRHVADRVEALRSGVRGETLVVSYRVPAVAHRSAGVLLFDAFSDRNHRAGLYGGADEVVLRAPDGYRVANRPAGESVQTNDTAVVWSGTHGVAFGEYAPSVEYTYVAFAPADSFAPGARGQAAIALAVGPTLVAGAAAVAALPALLLGGVGLLLARFASGRPARGNRRVAVSGLVVAVLAVAAVAFKLGEGTVPAAPLLALWLAVPAALYFALGYRERGGREPVALAALPFLAALVLSFDGAVEALFLAEGVVGALVVGVPAFLVGRAFGPGAAEGTA